MPSFAPPMIRATPFVRTMAIAALMSATVLAGVPTARAAASDTQLAQATAPATQPMAPAAQPASPTPANQAAPQAQTPQSQTPQSQTPNQTGDTSAESKAETVDERITSLHAALQITPQEETKWTRVADVMRDNATAMQKLVAERDSQTTTLTAVENLEQYEKFAQAHVTGLRKLITAFDTLYKSMPAAQKKVADQVFQNFGHRPQAQARS